MRYLVSCLGMYARQKAVLYFRRDSTGPARLYILFVSRGKLAITNVLDAEGVSFRTLIPKRKRLLVYVVDLKGELAGRIVNVKRRLRAHLTSLTGTGAFVGDQSNRDKAALIFEQEIRRYEASHRLVGEPCFQAMPPQK